MLPITKEYEPSRRRLRIKNKARLIITLLLILCTLSTVFIHRVTSSKTTFISYTVGYGDTYWGIANQLQQKGYKPRGDISTESGIPAHRLKEGDTILVPDVGGDY